MTDSNEVVLDGVRVVADNGLALKCVIDRREVWVGRLQILPGSTVRAVGDFGRLVIPTWLADDLGLLPTT
jgi:hypothetical protein